MARIVAETARLIVRAEKPGDLATWLEHMNTPAVMEHLGGVQSEEQVRAAFLKMAMPDPDAPGFHFIERKADGALIGKCGLSVIATPAAPAALRGKLQVGWSLRADCWGQGYATEAAGAMLALAFAPPYAAPVVYSQTSHGNGPSWRVMERLGMERVAAFDYDDPDYPARDNPTMVWCIAAPDADRA